MKDLALPLRELLAKAKAARTDVADVVQLRMIDVPPAGASFMVQKTLFVWVPDDRTPDDGTSSVASATLPALSPGRYRRATPAFPHMKS